MYRAWRWTARIVALPQHAASLVRSGPPERLVIAPQDIRTSDPTVAADIGAGYFAFGGRIVNAHGRSPFAIEPASDAWARQLAGFGWLRHLRAADTPGRRRQARQLVQNFLAAHARPAHDPAWRPAVAARRTLSWLSQSPVILDGADAAFYRAFMQTLETHRAHLERQLSGGLRGIDRLIVALALTEFGLCAQNATALQKRGAGPLPDESKPRYCPTAAT